jgi:EAL domain-containing protein (putative c-di-GMP-specific phosphodiesterase class I)
MRLLSAPVLHQVQLRYDVLSDVGTGRPAGLRADVVWVHPTWGDLPADDAWSAAERAGLQGVLRRWQLTQACRDAAGFPDAVDVGVQLPAGLTTPGTFADDVADALAVAGLPASRLVLCVPEQLLRYEPGSVLPALRAVHDTGVRLALTDRGAGTTLPDLIAGVPLDAVVVSLPRGLTATEAAALLAPQPA